MATLRHQVWINAPASRVFEALSTADGLGRWWVHHNSIESGGALVLFHNPGPEHGEVKMKVVDRQKDRRVEWEVVSEHPKTSPASAWMGTRIVFEFETVENPGMRLGIESGVRHLTRLEFSHSGWDETSEYFAFCNFAWGATLAMLKGWCERA